MTFPIRWVFIPAVVQPKGLTDELMMPLPTMHLAQGALIIEGHLWQCDRRKRLEDNGRPWHRRVPLVPWNRLVRYNPRRFGP